MCLQLAELFDHFIHAYSDSGEKWTPPFLSFLILASPCQCFFCMDSQTEGLGVEKEDEHSKAAAAMRADQIFLSLIFFLLFIVGRVCSMFRLQC